MIRLISLFVALFVSAQAEAQNQRIKWERAAVGTQPIALVFATNVDKDCKSSGESRFAIARAPSNGTLISKKYEGFSEFTGAYEKCNERKTDGLRVIYTANPGFKGKDNFIFIVVYSDGETRRYEIDMTVY